MRILFVRPKQPSLTRGLRHITVCEPLEFEYLGAAVPESEIRLVDQLLDEDLSAALNSFRPELVGTTCYINNTAEALAVCRAVKRFDAGIRTAIGGAHAVLNPGDFENPAVDVIVHGEGVTTFRRLVAAIESGASPAGVPGIRFKAGSGFVDTGSAALPDDADQFPLPDRELTRAHWGDYHYMAARPLALVKTSWGCPYACTFCYNRQMTGGRYLARSPESVATELESLEAPHVFFIDDVFFFDRQRSWKTAELIANRGIRKEYAAYCRTDFIAQNEPLLGCWREVGLRVLRVGMEAVTERELGEYDKRLSLQSHQEAIEVCRRLDLKMAASFIIRPDYGKQDFRQLRRYIRGTGLTHVFINPLTPLPGTDLYARVRSDVIADHRTMAALWDFQHCVLRPTRLSLRAYYRQMGLTYLAAFAPRGRRPAMRLQRRLPLKAIWKLIAFLWDIFTAYRDHDRARRAAMSPQRGEEGGAGKQGQPGRTTSARKRPATHRGTIDAGRF